jgi:hypothetical protein
MLLASKGIIPPKEWEHNPEVKCKDIRIGNYYYDGNTVAMILA